MAVLAFIGVLMPDIVAAAGPACAQCRQRGIAQVRRSTRIPDCENGMARVARRLARTFDRCQRQRCRGAGDFVEDAPPDVGVHAAEICGSACSDGSCNPSVSDALLVRCLPNDNVQVLTPVVAARRDGVHVEVFNDPGQGEVGLRSLGFPDRQWWSGSDGLAEPLVRPVPVGDGRVWCIKGPLQRHDDRTPEGGFTIVDPREVFVSYALDCPVEEQRRLEVSVGPFRGSERTVEAAVLDAVVPILAADVIEVAGYVANADHPDCPAITARVLRAGRIIANLDILCFLGPDDQRGYVASSASVCADSGLERL
jgi:hypothetical protein